MSESGTRSAQTAKKILETLSDLTNPIEEQRKEPHSVSWSTKPRESFGSTTTSLSAQKQQEEPAPAVSVQPEPTLPAPHVSVVPQPPVSADFPFREPDCAPSGDETLFRPADAEIRFAFSNPTFRHTRAASTEAMRRLRESSAEIAKKGPVRSDGSEDTDVAQARDTNSSGVSSFAVDNPDEESKAAPVSDIKADPNSVWAQFMSKPKVFCPFCKVDNPPEATKCSCDNYLACPHCGKRNDVCAEKLAHIAKRFRRRRLVQPPGLQFSTCTRCNGNPSIWEWF